MYNNTFLWNVVLTKKLVPHSSYCSSLYHFYVPNKVNNNLLISKFLLSSQFIALGSLYKKRSFSSGAKLQFKRGISFEYISKLGIKTYENPATKESRELMRNDNKGKIGVYCWFNNINGKFYIGSGDPLYVRLSDYYQDWYYLARISTYIVRALSKHGMGNFSLVILEYCTSDDLIHCEQKWIDLLKPEYNLNPLAVNSKGYKHTSESIEKIRSQVLGRKHSDQVKKAMSESRKGINNNFYGKKHSTETLDIFRVIALDRTKLSKVGVEVEITDLETKLTTTYESIRKAASAINSDIKSLSRREKSQLEKGVNTPYRGRYVIVFKRSAP